jgi:hypothetical protein
MIPQQQRMTGAQFIERRTGQDTVTIGGLLDELAAKDRQIADLTAENLKLKAKPDEA